MHNRNKMSSVDKIAILGAGILILSSLRKGSRLNPLKLAAGSVMVYQGLKNDCFRPIDKLIDKKYTEVRNVNIKLSVTVNKPRHEVYAFWRKIDNFPLFMRHLKDVSTIDATRSRWQLSVPGNAFPIEWESEIVKDEVNERIGWHSVEGTVIENAGNIHFEDAGKFGTEVHAVISYRAPGGKITELIGKLFNPLFEGMIKEDIKNFKRYIESGELPSIENQPSGN